MGKRIRLGLIFLWDSSWLGGVYYIQNLIKALDTLEDEKKPIVDVHCLNDNAFTNLQLSTDYPYLEKTLVDICLWKRILRKVIGFFSMRYGASINIMNLNSEDDVFFPWCIGKPSKKFLYWKPDFQEKHFPEYFSKTDLKKRDRIIKEACLRKIPIVFSSNDSKSDFIGFFPEYRDNKTYVLHFAANSDDFSNVDIVDLKNKYGIKKDYLICTNQFWKHKNHLFLFRAYHKALEAGLDLQLVCTGRMKDDRDPAYVEEIKDYIINNHLTNDILTLGMIDKKELLCLMNYSYAVVQPSLFEGWNTSVEDCKALGKFLFLSDIGVHREQMDNNVCFFNPLCEEDLAEKLLTIKPVVKTCNYSDNVEEFGENFYMIIESIIKERCLLNSESTD